MQETQHARFHFRELQQLRDAIAAMGLDIPLSEELAPLGQPVRLAGRTAPNRFLAQPMEGFDADADGAPGDLTFRRYRRYAEGGFGTLWFEATAVLQEARSNPGQLWLHAGNVARYRELTQATRQAARRAWGREPVLIVQLTHSGRYSKPTGVPRPLIAHRSPILDPLHKLPADYPLVSDDYLDRLQDIYVAAARLAAQAGFDGVDIKSCHRYLVSELLASFTREGRYGGSFENRSRLLRETLERIAAEVPDIFITTRMNAFDAIRHPYGFGVSPGDELVPDLREPVALARLLRAAGIPLLNISIGNPYFNPHVGRPYDFAIQGAKPPAEHPLAGLARFMEVTRQMQAALPDIPVVGSGYSWLRQFMPYAAAGAIARGGAGLMGIGRGAFAYPDAVRDILERGRMDPAKCCVACSACTQIMRDGGRTGCVVRDSAIYGPEYRRARRFALDRLQAEARRCRECEEPTCVPGCPARIEIPAFIRAFADGDFRQAYEILRRRNVLPEMCGYVCPSEVQCEGGCVEKTFCNKPIPIRDIQLVTCQIARREGYAGARLPEKASGRRVAVVGGGPSGLACAIGLLERGHGVTLIDRAQRLGGTPDALIPPGRYGQADGEVEAILAPARQAGRLEVRLGVALGGDLDLAALRRDHDAVYLALGLGGAATLGSAEGVVDAPAFLRDAKSGRIARLPARVAVLGAGNTAMDAAVTARELGARDVYLVYRRSFAEMPAWPAEREKFMASGGHCLVLTQPLGYVTEAGRVTGLRIARTELGEPDASGRRRPRVVPGTESVLAVEMVVEALGQQLSDELRGVLESAGVRLGRAGLVEVGAGSWATSAAGIYAGGDLVNGGTTVVQGVREGLEAADEIDAALTGHGCKCQR